MQRSLTPESASSFDALGLEGELGLEDELIIPTRSENLTKKLDKLHEIYKRFLCFVLKDSGIYFMPPLRARGHRSINAQRSPSPPPSPERYAPADK